jgi:uncharacterized cupredoxin-like copper-binding protein
MLGLALTVSLAVPLAAACGDDSTSSSSTDALKTSAAKTVQAAVTQVVTQAQGVASSVASSVASAKAVGAKLTDSSIELDRSVTFPGDNTFDITNSGSKEHDFIILKTDIAPGQLPTKNDKVDTGASGVDKVDSKTNIGAGKTATLKADSLTSGKYVVISNHSGDYAAGMYAGFTIP